MTTKITNANITNTGVSAGSYTNTNLTVNAQGQITAASNGTGGGGTPGGSDTQVQFNDSGSFGGDAGLTYNKTTDTLTATGGFSGPHNGTVGATTASSGVFTTCRANSWFVGSTNLTMYGDTSSSVGVVLSQAGNMTIQNGNLVIGTSGKGIDFSATPGTGTSELLADYEEGTWTPALKFGGNSTGMTISATGKYTKIGNVVYWSCDFVLSAKGSSTGSATITGLPFTSFSGTYSPAVVWAYDMASLTGSIIYRVGTNSTTIGIYQYDSTGSNNAVTQANFNNTCQNRAAGFYFV